MSVHISVNSCLMLMFFVETVWWIEIICYLQQIFVDLTLAQNEPSDLNPDPCFMTRCNSRS